MSSHSYVSSLRRVTLIVGTATALTTTSTLVHAPIASAAGRCPIPQGIDPASSATPTSAASVSAQNLPTFDGNPQAEPERFRQFIEATSPTAAPASSAISVVPIKSSGASSSGGSTDSPCLGFEPYTGLSVAWGLDGASSVSSWSGDIAQPATGSGYDTAGQPAGSGSAVAASILGLPGTDGSVSGVTATLNVPNIDAPVTYSAPLQTELPNGWNVDPGTGVWYYLDQPTGTVSSTFNDTPNAYLTVTANSENLLAQGTIPQAGTPNLGQVEQYVQKVFTFGTEQSSGAFQGAVGVFMSMLAVAYIAPSAVALTTIVSGAAVVGIAYGLYAAIMSQTTPDVQ